MIYSKEFYSDRDSSTRYSAKKILGRVFDLIPEINSCVDVGCGVGTWLSVLKSDFNVTKVCGVEGPWVPTSSMVIDRDEHLQIDISKNEIVLNSIYDLSVCLEVAEHLNQTRAEMLVRTLCQQSNFVLFSAAIPGQPGVDHVNCHWPKYWQTHFERHGFVALDVIRSQIWDDDKIPYWYRQNVILYCKNVYIDRLSSAVEVTAEPVLSLVHPMMLEYYRQPYTRRLIKTFLRKKSTSG